MHDAMIVHKSKITNKSIMGVFFLGRYISLVQLSRDLLQKFW
jgi:hypothetical protein